jgi:predicted nucleic acid-binding protein
MILVDTSVWADHLRRSDKDLTELLLRRAVVTHPFVIEELACGHLPDREEFLTQIHSLPRVPVATHEEALDLISNRKLYGTGLGSVDVHIIASAMLGGARIWSRDKAMVRESRRLRVSFVK